MGDLTRCSCNICNCTEEFEIIDKEEFLNLVIHGRLEQSQINSIKKRIGIDICKNCLLENHTD